MASKKALATFVQGFHDPAVIQKMVYREFGKTQRQVSAFSYGASALGGVFSDGAVDEEESLAVVRETIKMGVNLIDVAPWYGFGKAETVLGRALKGIPREAYYLHTKVGRYEADIIKRFDFSYERTLKSIDESLERLGVAYIDTVQIHDPEFSPSMELILEETVPAIVEAQRLGKVKSLGSCYACPLILAAQHSQVDALAGITGYPLETLRYLAEHIKHPIASAISYCHYTLHDQSLVLGTLDYLQARGLGVICASPTSMGLLTPSGPPDWHPSSPQLKQRAKQASAICDKYGVNFARVALGFALSNHNIPTIMGSYSKFSELRDNLSLVTGTNPLNALEKKAQEEILSGPFANLGAFASWEGYEVDKYWIKVGKTLMLQRYAAS